MLESTTESASFLLGWSSPLLHQVKALFKTTHASSRLCVYWSLMPESNYLFSPEWKVSNYTRPADFASCIFAARQTQARDRSSHFWLSLPELRSQFGAGWCCCTSAWIHEELLIDSTNWDQSNIQRDNLCCNHWTFNSPSHSSWFWNWGSWIPKFWSPG